VSYRDPTLKELADPLFERIWETIKTWDINVPEEYAGYTGATGNHVCAILDAVKQAAFVTGSDGKSYSIYEPHIPG
jgi:hypothetical protein